MGSCLFPFSLALPPFLLAPSPLPAPSQTEAQSICSVLGRAFSLAFQAKKEKTERAKQEGTPISPLYSERFEEGRHAATFQDLTAALRHRKKAIDPNEAMACVEDGFIFG